MAKSIMQNEKVCFLCGSTRDLEKHHAIHGIANRKWSEKYGLWIWLCPVCHREGPSAVHRNRVIDMWVIQEAQRKFEATHGDRTKFRKIFGKSYL